MKTPDANIIVVKVGTDVVTTPEGKLDSEVIHNLVDQVVAIRHALGQVLLVTSGAMAAGRMRYNRVKQPDESRETKRMYAAAGQTLLQRIYEDRLASAHGLVAHQILITRDMFESGPRIETLLGTLKRIQEDDVPGQPIFNENDPIADDEIRFSDNDQLASNLATLVGATRMVLLTGKVQGLMRDIADPTSVLQEVTPGNLEEMRRFVRAGASANGTGGMELKFGYAAELAASGIQTHIANGKLPNVLERLLIKNERLGTTFTTA